MAALRDSGIKLNQVQRVPYENAFLIGDLLTDRITLLAGEPKAGKTLLAVGMVIALLNGEDEFLGLPVHRQLKHVVFGLSDDGAMEELRERFVGAVDESRITVFPVTNTGAANYWTDLRDELREQDADLFVLDNILGSLGDGDDITSSVTATTIIRNLRPISAAGIPVLAVTHTPKGAVEGSSVASSPIGGRAIGGGARGIVALRNSKSGGHIIQTAINRAKQNLNLKVNVQRLGPGADVPVWSIRERERAEPARGKDTSDRVQALVGQVLQEQPALSSLNAIAKAYGPTYGWKAETARKRLQGRIKHDGTKWTEEPAA